MMIRLGINTGFALNRFSTPEEWISLVSDVFGIKVVQFTADLLNPSLPDEIIDNQISNIKQLSVKYGIEIRHTFTSAFTRVNHLAHPDIVLRNYWLNWFKRFVDISTRLGAESMGSHLGILTVRDYNDPVIRKQRLLQVFRAWREIAAYGAEKGLKYLLWEPMSIPREMGHTIKEAKKIHKLLNTDMPIAMRLCLDLDHGDTSSINPEDTDPYIWIQEFASEISIIHLKQTNQDKSGHWPFVDEYNKKGKITPKRLIDMLEKTGIDEITLILELSFRERQPFESRVIDDIRASIEYWRPFVTL